MIVIASLLPLAAVEADPSPTRAELCLAHVEAMITEAQQETGRVAGPGWLIRDWWSARLPEQGGLDREQRTRLELSMPERRAADPERHRAELQACVDEAIEGGALP